MGSLVWILVGLSCVASRQLTQGVAIWPFVLGTEVELEELASLRGTAIIVAVVNVNETYDIGTAPVSGAEVTVDGPGLARVTLDEQSEGLYVLPPDLAITSYEVGADYLVTALVDGEIFTTQATSASALDIDAVWDDQDRKTGFKLELPEDYGDEYDQVLFRVTDETGSVTWTTWPETTDDWLQFASSEETPTEIEIPSRAFENAGPHGVSVLGAVRARESAVRSDNLKSEVSGFTTGAGYAHLLVVIE